MAQDVVGLESAVPIALAALVRKAVKASMRQLNRINIGGAPYFAA